MYDALPDVKLIYLLRDPLDRAISHYMHNYIHPSGVQHGAKSIDEVFQPVEYSGYLNASRYYDQISRYLEYYEKENVLILTSERLRQERRETMNDIFQFLGVRKPSGEVSPDEEHNRATVKQQKTSLGVFLRKTRLGSTLKEAGKKMMPSTVIERGRRILWRPVVEKPRPSDAVRAEARAYLKEDIERLRSLTGKPFDEWSL